MEDHFLADNLIEGPSTWPRTRASKMPAGIQISGQGHVVCYNRIRGFADAIDTFPSPRCAAIDIHNNDLSELTDDGIEMDYSERNTRCFHNRLTNVFQGISIQPVFGGPVYVFRNVMYNVAVEPFKLHNSPSGCLIFHNTVVKHGMPALLYTPETVRHCLSRNNLYVGTAGRYAMEYLARMIDCDYDYDGFAGGPFANFLRWNGVRYGTLDELRCRAPVLRHARLLDTASLFAAGTRPPKMLQRSIAPGSTSGSLLAQRPSTQDRRCPASKMLIAGPGPTWVPTNWASRSLITARGVRPPGPPRPPMSPHAIEWSPTPWQTRRKDPEFPLDASPRGHAMRPNRRRLPRPAGREELREKPLPRDPPLGRAGQAAVPRRDDHQAAGKVHHPDRLGPGDGLGSIRDGGGEVTSSRNEINPLEHALSQELPADRLEPHSCNSPPLDCPVEMR